MSSPLQSLNFDAGGLRLAAKAALVGFLMLVLLVPLGMINGTVRERQAYRQQAVAAVAESFAGPQTLVGPVLVLPFVDEVPVQAKDALGKEFTRIDRRRGSLTYFPATLALDGTLRPSIRRRGLHEVRVYQLRSELAAGFDIRVPAPADGVTRHYDAAYASLGIADVRGLAGSPTLTVDGKAVALAQGPGAQREGQGLHAMLAAPVAGERLKPRLQLRSAIDGTESLAIAPVADSNRITLESPWPHPQFAGRFLPGERSIGPAGFRARWDVSSLAAGTQQQYRSGGGELDALAVSLVDPVNPYSQADRASKYGVLFVVLTFLGFFLLELVRRLRIHPIQYLLVGLALAIFFLLLLALSEHLAFGLAYLLSSLACIALLGAYTAAILHSARRGLAFAGALGLLYAALYGLLVSEDNALVLGALMLFAILATLMMATRRVDWYRQAAEG